MMFSKTTWKELVERFSIYDCAIRDRDNMYFLMYSGGEENIEFCRFLFVYCDLPEKDRFYTKTFNHFTFASIAYRGADTREFLSVDMSGHVYSYDVNRDGEEKPLDSPWLNNKIIKDNMRSSISQIKRINGEVYAVANQRQLFIREGINKWSPLANTPKGIPFPMKVRPGESSAILMGVADIDAFGLNDMYAVGGVGDVWHYNGKAWRQIHFPSNELLYTVCCAGDGNVYITGNMGSLWVGREDRWKKLQDGELSLSFKDSAWFAGKLFCGNDYGLWVKSPEGELLPLRESEGVNSLVATSCGRIDISPDGSLMLTAGPNGATLYDGKKWEVLFNAAQF